MCDRASFRTIAATLSAVDRFLDAAGDASGNHLGAERDALLRGIVARYGNW